jgi:hypothetical protein
MSQKVSQIGNPDCRPAWRMLVTPVPYSQCPWVRTIAMIIPPRKNIHIGCYR